MTIHTCHWPDCKRVVPPRMWGCTKHWFALPKALRDRIWAAYVPGQEVTKTPSPAYIDAAHAAQEWIAQQQPELYRPSNGTEGACFFNDFCGLCERDKHWEEGAGCEILAATYQYNVDDPNYPREWIRTSNGPKCTAFVPLGEPLPTPRCQRTADMFGGNQ